MVFRDESQVSDEAEGCNPLRVMLSAPLKYHFMPGRYAEHNFWMAICSLSLFLSFYLYFSFSLLPLPKVIYTCVSWLKSCNMAPKITTRYVFY
jgi:hypothetical protein